MAEVTIITGRMYLRAREPTINPVSVERKNWISPVKGSSEAAAINARAKQRIKIPAR